MNELKKCSACDDYFEWNDDVIVVDDKFYHRDCVTLYPTGYVAYLDDEYLGETENDDGDAAFEILEDGEYVDVEDEE